MVGLEDVLTRDGAEAGALDGEVGVGLYTYLYDLICDGFTLSVAIEP